jgi:acetyl esterase/lipase
MARPPVYRGMTQAELDRAYDNRGHVASYAAILARWAEESAALYATVPVLRDLSYDSGPRHRIDLFPAASLGRPTLFFIHGGYWQWCDKEEEAFIARGPLAHDINVAVVEYTLCPATNLDGIVAEMHSAVDWLTPRLFEFGADPKRLIVGGSSAGAHLAAMLTGRADVQSALLVSGNYNLEPIRHLGLNAVIGLDEASALRNSPILHLPVAAGPVCFAVGGGELPEMIRQTDEYHAAWTKAGLPGCLLHIDGTDHFTVMDELSRPDGQLTAALVNLVGAGEKRL